MKTLMWLKGQQPANKSKQKTIIKRPISFKWDTPTVHKRFKIYRKILIMSTVLLSTVGCASLFSDASQPVSIDTPSCKEAKCRATNSDGVYYAAATPATIVVNKAFGDLTIVCEKGDQRATSVHKSSATAATFGNILMGGPVGALIDGGTGKGYSYPSMVINPISCEEKKSDGSNFDQASEKCKKIGFKPGSEKFGECVLKLN